MNYHKQNGNVISKLWNRYKDNSNSTSYLQLQGTEEEVPHNLYLPLKQESKGRRKQIPMEDLIIVKWLLVSRVIRSQTTTYLAKQPPICINQKVVTIRELKKKIQERNSNFSFA